MLSTMVYADEVNDPSSIPELEDVAEVELSERELAMATQLVESLAADFEPERFHDTYREAVLELIDRKAAGEDVVVPINAAAARQGGRPHGRARGVGGRGQGGPEAPPHRPGPPRRRAEDEAPSSGGQGSRRRRARPGRPPPSGPPRRRAPGRPPRSRAKAAKKSSAKRRSA